MEYTHLFFTGKLSWIYINHFSNEKCEYSPKCQEHLIWEEETSKITSQFLTYICYERLISCSFWIMQPLNVAWAQKKAVNVNFSCQILHLTKKCLYWDESRGSDTWKGDYLIEHDYLWLYNLASTFNLIHVSHVLCGYTRQTQICLISQRVASYTAFGIHNHSANIFTANLHHFPPSLYKHL